MAPDPAFDFDLGPLSWVQAEIDQALARGLDALAAFVAQKDLTSLKHARTHVHQAAGAIQMVGLDAVVAFTDEVERHLARLEDLPEASVADAVALIDRSCRKLRIFLDELVNGAAPVPLKLYPEYESMQHARGVRAVAPTDLFYPDLSAKPPRIPPREAMPQNKLPSHLIKQRRHYQRGLLAWLRGDEQGAVVMRDAIAGIEDVTQQSSLRAFWWTVGALLESVTEQGVEGGFGVKQLLARIDLQIRRIAEGGAKVADRLRREVLYYAAISAPVGPQVQAVQRAFHLSGLIPTVETIETDVVGLQPLIREAREQLAGAKDTWLKFASGRAENLPKLKATLTSVHTKAAKMKQGALMKLTSTLVERLDKMPSSGVSEPVAMEYATGLLLAESAFENHAKLGSEFPQQVDQIIGRLDAARAGRAPPGGDAPMLDEMSKRAQERVLLAQVGREIQANLRHMEQVLDAFFRDNGKRADLSTLTKDSLQIRGALTILGLSEAERLLGLCQTQIEAYADPATPVNNEDLELLAESLSGLGFYIEAVEQQRPDRERLIAPLIAKRLGEAAAPVIEQRDSVEDAVEKLRGELPALVEEMHRAPADEGVRAGLRKKLTSLRDDAELIGDAFLVDQVDAAVREVDAGGTANLTAVVDAIADTNAPAPELSDETQRLLEVDAQWLDAELLEIYLTEAGEVLDAIRASGDALEQNLGDREALATIRRGFHTLKGSGRMVGLNELGEFAYDAEKLHNRLLEEERPVTAAVLRMIRVAHDTFREWVDALREKGRVTPDPKGLHEAIRAVEAELPGRESVIGSLPKSVPPDAAPPAPVLSIVPPPAGPSPGQRKGAADAAPPIVAPTLTRVASAIGELPELGTSASHAAVVDILEGEDSGEASTVAPDSPGDAVDALGFPPLESPLVIGVPTLKLVADNARPVSSIAPAEPPTLTVAPAIDAAGDPEFDDDVDVGGVVLSATLWRILADEAGQHLATLEHELAILQFDPQQVPSAAMIRASHTLCGIHRTGGFHLIAAQAKTLELTLIALAQRDGVMPAVAQPVLARAVAGLRHFVGSVQRREPFHAYDQAEAQGIAAELDDLRSEAMAGEPIDAETAAEQAARDDESAKGVANRGGIAFSDVSLSEAGSVPSMPLLDAGAQDHAEVSAAPLDSPADPLAGVVDEIEDETVLMIFLEEASELLPQAGESLRSWRRAPDDTAAARQLQRTLHTLKGSARMAGAMRLGELTHLMESRLIEGDDLAPATPERFDALDGDLDRVAHMLDRLRAGETNVPLDEPSHPPATFPPPSAALPVVVTPHFPGVSDTVAANGDPVFAEGSAPDAFPVAETTPFAVPTSFASTPLSTHVEAESIDVDPSDAAATSAVDPIDAASNAAAPDALTDSAAIVEPIEVAPVELAPLHTATLDAAPVEAVAVEVEPLDAAAREVASVETVATTPAPGDASVPTPPVRSLEEVVTPLRSPVEVVVAAPVQAPQPTAPAPAETDAGPKAMLRVRADTIDRLVNEAGEVAIARARVEGELRALKANLLELTGSVIRLRTQVREIEIQADSQIQSHLTQMQEQPDFDPLEFDRFTRFQELTRSLAEGINDVSTVQQSLLKNLDDADAALLAQARLSREVQQKLFAIRTAPFNSLSERLYRIVRSVAKELGKRANLEILGGQTELDRSVLEKLVGPLEHLLRNSLDHGLETREARRAAGKAEQGEITLKVRQAGNEVAIELADDGGGIDLDRVREKAKSQGTLPDASQATEAQLLEYIFKSGVSTATKITTLSGRGVGLDVVRADITALGGRVEVASERSRGTRFTLSLPLTLAVAQAVLVRAGGRLWALPAPMVEQVQQVREQALLDLYVKREVEWQGKHYPFHYLPRLLGDQSRNPETKRYNAVLLLKTGQGVAAIHVDEMIGNQEIVVKNIGPQLARVSGISGATVLGTGEIVLIIHPVQLAQRAAIPTFDPNAEQKAATADVASGLAGPPLVLVVDDSLTVRKITSRLLGREGFAVMTAKDGVDALQVLAEHTPDVILLDIEMPRMDGFEFTKTLRNEPKHAHIPIIMITSRTADKHRARAAELGVDLYLGKPYQEDELLRNLREMLGVTAPA